MPSLLGWAAASGRDRSAARPVGRRGATQLACLLLTGLVWCTPARAASPYIWDQDGDHIDDRIGTVNALGYQFSFVGADTLAQQRILVSRANGGLAYGVYVVYDHTPTDSDFSALTLLGMPVLHRLEAVAAARSVGTYAQIEAARMLPGVVRIEAVPVLYPLLYENAAAVGVRDASQRVFPTWEGTGGAQGQGVVIAFLDTGINDAADGSYPGHESLAGRFVGGAQFLSSDSTTDTPPEGSVNPDDHGNAATSSHATHVAGIALGTGGPSGYARGVAPQAHFVDVKALSDAGSGTGIAEALDWCIHNRARDWGVPGTNGIQVINLSLSSPDLSDGNDVVSQLAARAVQLGIVVVASMGNDGTAQHVPSPAAGDGVLAVGAFDSQRTPTPGDDQFASFSNQGPRADDGNPNPVYDAKPDLVAPGVAILSADGDLTSDGHQYHRLSGTSMSAAFVSGAAACLLSQYPGITPAQIGTLLRETAWRGLNGVPSGPPLSDPRWQAARGFGCLDLYAAKLEMDQPARSQVARLELSGAGSSITAVVRTQRERGAAFFAIERAPDAGGTPGAFAGVDSVAAAGDSSLADPANRSSYTRVWSVPPAENGVTFWYRVAYSEGGTRWTTPARAFTSPAGPAVATVEFTIAHNAYDHDVTGEIVAGDSTGSGPLNAAASFGVVVPLPGTSAAVSTDWVDGVSATGNVAWTFRVDIADPQVANYLPPRPGAPWRLHADEGGYLDRSGRVTAFTVTWHAPYGDIHYQGGPVPAQTLEGQETVLTAPVGMAGVGLPAPARGLAYGPNPARAGSVIQFALAARAAAEIRVFDLAGREVGRVPLVASGGIARGAWRARDARERALPPGIYLARAGALPAVRIAILQ